MKKLLAILLSVLLLMVCVPLDAIPVMAATSGTTGDCTWTLDGTHLTISGNGAMGDYAYSATPWDWSITSVTIENGVTSIGHSAFYDCYFLESVIIPDSVDVIGEDAFFGCTSLTAVTIGDGVTTIDDSAFANCHSLKSVTIPDSVITIGGGAFLCCYSLTSVTISDSVIIIGDYAFSSCTSLKLVTIPDGVTVIGDHTFSDCDSLASVFIGDSVTTIGKWDFYGCDNLAAIRLPSSLTEVDAAAFAWCESLTDVYYAGSEADRANITIGDGNDYLLDAAWHYNWEQETPDGAVSLEGMPIVDHGSYQGNEGDSTVFNLDGKGLTQNNDGYTFNRYGNVGVDGTVFSNGFEVWIARWNGIPEISWAYATFDLGGAYTTLTGKTNLIDSYNIDNFDTTVYFYDDDTLLTSYRLTDSDYQKEISVDVTGVQQLKMYVEDNVAVEGGTSLALHDMFLSGDGAATPTVTLGDVNNDGRINNRDLGLLQQHLADWDVEIVLAADVNADGRVNNKDLGLLQQYLAGWDVTFG